MAEIGGRYFTFRDIEAGKRPDGTFDADVVNLMSQENPVLKDIPWKQCLRGREDVTTIRTGVPDAVLRMYYEGVRGSKGTKKQVVNSCATCSTAIEFDWRLYEQTDNRAAFLGDEQRAHADVIGQLVATALFYGDIAANPKGINGFAKTLSVYGANGSTVCNDTANAAHYVYSAGATGGNAHRRSIFLIGWGARSAHGIYPQGTSAGIQMGQVRSQYIDDGSNDHKQLLVGIQEINWDIGLNIRDFRYCGRIGDIDIGGLFKAPSDQDFVDITALIRRMLCRVKAEGVTQRLYMPRVVWEGIVYQFGALTQGNAIKFQDLEQKKDASVMGIPVAFNDALNVDEAALTAYTA